MIKRVLLGLVVLALFMAGCARSRLLSQTEIVLAAHQAAIERGVDLAAFEAPTITPANQRGVWLVHYQGKVPSGEVAKRGNFFLVAVDEGTGKTRFVPGR